MSQLLVITWLYYAGMENKFEKKEKKESAAPNATQFIWQASVTQYSETFLLILDICAYLLDLHVV